MTQEQLQSPRPDRPWHRRRSIVPAVIGLAALVLTGGALVAATVLPDPAEGTPIGPSILRYRGVNFAGAEFKSNRLPGVPFKDYVFPNRGTAAPFVAMGLNAARLPVRWERLQRSAMAPLDAGELRRIDDAVMALGALDLVVIDLHNYARYRGVMLGADPTSLAALADVWRKLAAHWKGNPRIAFGLMNEPNGLGATVWRDLAQGALSAIRQTGARNLVLVPGVRWTGAHSWTAGPDSNADAMQSFRDPANNVAFEMHQYVDGNSSGTSSSCVDPDRAAARLNAATNWLRQNHARGFLGEFGAAPNAGCLASLDRLLDKVDQGSDVWLGWTYWAAGAWWGQYAMSVQPDRRGPKPQAAVLARHLPGRRP